MDNFNNWITTPAVRESIGEEDAIAHTLLVQRMARKMGWSYEEINFFSLASYGNQLEEELAAHFLPLNATTIWDDSLTSSYPSTALGFTHKGKSYAAIYFMWDYNPAASAFADIFTNEPI